MEKGKLNREWVKTAAIIFLAVMLVLTFFSNTIMNRSLVEVSTAEVTNGTITSKIRGTGTVSAIGNTEIKATGTATVATVKARDGAEVEAGDILFIMGESSEELQTALAELEDLRFELQQACAGGESAVSKYEMEKATAEYEAAAKAVEKIQQKIDNHEFASEEEIKAAKAALAEAEGMLDAVKNTQDLLVSKALEAYKADPTEENRIAYENAQMEAAAAISEAQQNVDAAKKALDGLVTEENMYKQLSDATDKMNEAWTKKEDAVEAYNEKVKAQNKSAASNGIAIAKVQAKIARQEEKIAQLKGGEDNAITAPVAGTVSSVSASPGAKVAKGDILCIIEVPDMGYTMSFTVTNEQAKRLRVGDTATISNFYWGSEIRAEVASIKVDPKNPQTNKLITVNLDGDVNNGSELTVSIGQKSASYESVIPSSAVRTDSNGSFVLAIEAKNSALGNRYFARRVPVEVLASDDTNSAISSTLSYGDFVITSSSAPIKNGNQVRMSDTNE